MDQVIHILETEKVQTIVKIDGQPELIIEALKKSKFLDGRVKLNSLIFYPSISTTTYHVGCFPCQKAVTMQTNQIQLKLG